MGTDADAGSMLSYRTAAGLDSASFEIQGSDTLRFKFSPDYESPLDVGRDNHYNLSLEVSDGVNTVRESLTVKVTDENDPPILILADTISVREGINFVVKLSGTDDDPMSMLSYRIVYGLDSASFEIQGLDTLRFKSSPVNNHYNLLLEVSDGLSATSKAITIIVIDENEVITHIPAENTRIAIYPNPTTGLVFINIDNLTKVSIKISTIQGQVLFHRENVEGRIHALDILSEQRTGVYFMEITYPGNKEIFKILRE